MCYPASGITTRERTYIDADSDEHKGILKKNGIPDKNVPANFVAWEITPPDSDYRKPLDEWVFRVDDNFPIPDWYNKEWVEQEARRVLTEWAKTHIIREGEHECKDGQSRIVLGGVVNQSGGEVCGVNDGGVVNQSGGKVWYVNDGGVVNQSGGEVWYVNDGGVVNQSGGKVWYVNDGGVVNKV